MNYNGIKIQSTQLQLNNPLIYLDVTSQWTETKQHKLMFLNNNKIRSLKLEATSMKHYYTKTFQ